MIINKKGELTTQQLVTIIVLIVSFAVLLILLWKLNLGETTDKEICHNSVLMKSRGEGFVGKLDCKTNYVCISGGGECEGLGSATTIKLDVINRTEVMKAIADEMADCWWMFGEGEAKYVGTLSTGTHCALCSIIAFDSEIQKNGETSEGSEGIKYTDFYDYLGGAKKDKTQTYLKYLYGVSKVPEFKGEYLGNFFDFEKSYSVLTGINKFEWEDLFILSPLTWFSDDKDLGFSTHRVVVLEKSKESYDKLGCEEFITKA